MAVIIKNMDMPESCYDCWLCYDNYMCNALGKRYFIGYGRWGSTFDPAKEKLKDCPLEEFKENETDL